MLSMHGQAAGSVHGQVGRREWRSGGGGRLCARRCMAGLPGSELWVDLGAADVGTSESARRPSCEMRYEVPVVGSTRCSATKSARRGKTEGDKE